MYLKAASWVLYAFYVIRKNSKIVLYADDIVLYKSITAFQRFLDMHDFQQDVNR